MNSPAAITRHFAQLQDPRVDRTKLHNLLDIVVIAILAVIAGCEGWAEIALYGRTHQAWLKTFLRLPNGIPSRDTFRRVIARLDPQQFLACFTAWMQALCTATQGELVAIDGKTLRHSFDQASGRNALHLVGAWAARNRLVLGQVAVEDQSNEITAIPKLLELIDVQGAVVTIDAIGCQTAIAETIRRRGADYVLAVKGNQEHLHDDIRTAFLQAMEQDFAGWPHHHYVTREQGHGRVETRDYYSMAVPDDLRHRDTWRDLQSIGLVISTRQVRGQEETGETRFYISSLPSNARRLAEAVRGHWGIENRVHWVLDVTFREDDSRVHKDHGAANLACLRRLAINLLQRDQSRKLSLRQKRLLATWDHHYILEVLHNA